MTNFNPLPYMPNFPSEEPAIHPDVRNRAWWWAALLVQQTGTDAPFHALSAIFQSLAAGDTKGFRGWRNIIDAMGDVVRSPTSDDTIH